MDTLYILSHTIHAITGIILILSSYIAIKKFKISIWKKAWYFIAAAGFFITTIAIMELLEYGFIETSAFHIVESLAVYGLIAIGIWILADTAKKIWG